MSEWTSLHAAVSVLKDVYKELLTNREEEDMEPEQRELLIEEIEDVLIIPDLAAIYANFVEEEEEIDEDT